MIPEPNIAVTPKASNCRQNASETVFASPEDGPPPRAVRSSPSISRRSTRRPTRCRNSGSGPTATTRASRLTWSPSPMATRTCVCPPAKFPWATIAGRTWVSHNRDFDRAVFERLQEQGVIPADVGPRDGSAPPPPVPTFSNPAIWPARRRRSWASRSTRRFGPAPREASGRGLSLCRRDQPLRRPRRADGPGPLESP